MLLLKARLSRGGLASAGGRGSFSGLSGPGGRESLGPHTVWAFCNPQRSM